MAELDMAAKTASDALVRRPLPEGRVYHFNVIYNHARCPLSKTADTEMSLAWTQRAVETLQLMGLVNSYYHDRDCPKGQGLAQELARVIAGSGVTVVVLSPGFVRDCWPRYCLFSCFKSLFASGTSSASCAVSGSAAGSSGRYSPASSSARASSVPSSSSSSGSSSPRGAADTDRWQCGVVVVALGLGAGDLPAGLGEEKVLFFPNDWQQDGEAWGRLQASLMSTLPAGLVHNHPDAAAPDEQRTQAGINESPAPFPGSSLLDKAPSEDKSGVTSSLHKEHTGSPATSLPSSLLDPRPSEDRNGVITRPPKEHTGSPATSPRSSRDEVTSSLFQGHSRSPITSPRPSLLDPRPSEDGNGITASLSHTSTSTTSATTYRHSQSLYNGDSLKTAVGDQQSNLHSKEPGAGDAQPRSPCRPDSVLTEQPSPSSATSPPAAQGAPQRRGHTSADREETHLCTTDHSSRRVQRACGEEERAANTPSELDTTKTSLAQDGGQSYDLSSTSGGNRSSRCLDKQHEVHTAEDNNLASHVAEVKENTTDDMYLHTALLLIDKASQRFQGSKSVDDNGNVSTNSPSDNIESAVLDRLGQAGIRRELLQEKSMTKVCAKGSTLSAGTTHTPSISERRRDGHSRSANENNLPAQNFGSGGDAETKISNAGKRTENKEYSRRSEEEQESEVLGSQNISIQSSGRTTRFSDSHGHSPRSDPSKDLLISTNSYEKAGNGTLTSEKHDQIPYTDTTGFIEGSCSEESNQLMPFSIDRCHVVPQHHLQVFREARETSRSGSREDVGSNSNIKPVHSNQLGATLMSASAQSEKTEMKTSKIKASSRGQKLGKDTLPTKIHQEESLSASGTKVSNDDSYQATAAPQHLHEDFNLSTNESTNTRTEVDDTTSEYHHITSIEDDHDFSLNDYLSSSLTTSDYGTMSPRNDLSGISNADSGFLSSGLSSHGEISPRMSTPRSKIQENEKLTEDHTVSGREAAGDSVSVASVTERQDPEKANGDDEIVGTTSATRSSSGRYSTSVNKNPQSSDSMDLLMKIGEAALDLNPSDKPPALFSKHDPLEPPRIASEREGPVFGSNDSEYCWSQTSSGDITSTTECKVMETPPREAVHNEITGQVARAPGLSGDDITPATSRKDSWIYEDLDKGWTVAEVLLPLYRIMCYVLSRPEMPFF